MMHYDIDEHPAVEELTAIVLEHAHGDAEVHVRECPACARYVRELCMARDSIAELPEQDVPVEVERRILKHTAVRNKRNRPVFWGRLGEWYRNPLVIGVAVVLATIFFYVFFVFVLE